MANAGYSWVVILMERLNGNSPDGPLPCLPMVIQLPLGLHNTQTMDCLLLVVFRCTDTVVPVGCSWEMTLIVKLAMLEQGGQFQCLLMGAQWLLELQGTMVMHLVLLRFTSTVVPVGSSWEMIWMERLPWIVPENRFPCLPMAAQWPLGLTLTMITDLILAMFVFTTTRVPAGSSWEVILMEKLLKISRGIQFQSLLMEVQ
mmetsp:Transcript_17213/g.39919  ORF Transcript_17213/g.39919 Transcript_17213/m.39919 type:complete len:201 (-) Transcript_17213:720-1322(-)